MQKVITINLNGNAYQLDERGYDALHAYLQHADAQLGGNPDKAEIIRDLEQSIAEKCLRFLGPGKSVVSTVEVEQDAPLTEVKPAAPIAVEPIVVSPILVTEIGKPAVSGGATPVIRRAYETKETR